MGPFGAATFVTRIMLSLGLFFQTSATNTPIVNSSFRKNGDIREFHTNGVEMTRDRFPKKNTPNFLAPIKLSISDTNHSAKDFASHGQAIINRDNRGDRSGL